MDAVFGPLTFSNEIIWKRVAPISIPFKDVGNMARSMIASIFSKGKPW